MPRCRAVVVARLPSGYTPVERASVGTPRGARVRAGPGGYSPGPPRTAPRSRLHPCGRLPLELEEGRLQAFDGDMVQERRELRVPVLVCYFTHTVQRTARASSALCPGRVLLDRVPLGQLPSLHRLPVANASSA